MEINMEIEEHKIWGSQTLTVKVTVFWGVTELDLLINLIKIYSIV
jgi:hypothetical protein